LVVRCVFLCDHSCVVTHGIAQLADLGNLTLQWSIDKKDLPDNAIFTNWQQIQPFKNVKDIPIEVEDLEKEYCRLMHLSYPIEDITFVRSWMLFRVPSQFFLLRPCSDLDSRCTQLSVISQGIAARNARGQASSEVAWMHEHIFPVIGHLAKVVIQPAKHPIRTESKL
jgi:hypothetical protein